MIVYFHWRYFVRNFAQRLTRVICEQCGDEYYYQLIRTADGSGISVYALDNSGAEDRAARKAAERLESLVANECDSVACPSCGTIPREMQGRSPIVDGVILAPPALRPVAVTDDTVTLAPAAAPAVARSNARIVVPLIRGGLHNVCVGCGVETAMFYQPPMTVGSDWERPPACQACSRSFRRKWWSSALLPVASAVLATVLVMAFVPGLDTASRLVIGLPIAALAGLIAVLFAAHRAESPVRVYLIDQSTGWGGIVSESAAFLEAIEKRYRDERLYFVQCARSEFDLLNGAPQSS